MFKIGPKFHRLSVSWLTGDTRKIFVSKTVDESHSARVLIGCKPIISWPYNCVKSLKKVGHSILEIWAFVTPKIAPLDRVSCICKDISSSDV